MPLYGSCPVCAYLVTSRDPFCLRCEWELESEYTLGRLTSADHLEYKEQLDRAQQRWRKHQQQHAAERALAAAQARLQHVQRACIEARRPTTTETIAPGNTITPPVESPISSTPDSHHHSPPAHQQPLGLFRFLWWSLFRPDRLTQYRQQREER